MVKPLESAAPRCPSCDGETEPMLKPLVKRGEIVAELPEPERIRRYVLDQLKRLSAREGLPT